MITNEHLECAHECMSRDQHNGTYKFWLIYISYTKIDKHGDHANPWGYIWWM